MMRMLVAGGVDPVAGTMEGSYEIDDLCLVAGMGAGSLAGRAVKLLDYPAGGYGPLPRSVEWKFVWLDRDPDEQALSQVKLLGLIDTGVAAAIDPGELAANLRDERDSLHGWFLARGEMWTGSFEAVLANPIAQVGDLAHFLDRPFDEDAAAGVVLERAPACSAGLDIEHEILRSGRS